MKTFAVQPIKLLAAKRVVTRGQFAVEEHAVWLQVVAMEMRAAHLHRLVDRIIVVRVEQAAVQTLPRITAVRST